MLRLLPFLFLFPISVCGQTLTISVDKSHSIVDNQNHIIVCQIDLSDYQVLNIYDQINLEIAPFVYRFDPIVAFLTSEDSYTIKNGSTNYTLFFTQLPLTKIYADDVIEDEPKTLASLSYVDTSGVEIESLIGIEVRGGFSQTYPKKTYDIEFWEDSLGLDKEDYSFGTLREDDDWILDALYNEPLRIRSYISNKLWLDMHQPFYLNEEPDAKAGADNIYVEVALNDEYQGIFTLMEEVDRKQLQLEKEDDSIINGMLYKGISWGQPTFDNLSSFDPNSEKWNGFDIRYPKDTIFWQPLYDFCELVIDSDDATFNTEIAQHFSMENAIDYYLFLNLLSAGDNSGKNIFIGKHKQDAPYFYTPWDLDGVFGTDWQGNRILTSEGILENGLFRRLINQDTDGFRHKLKIRWINLRQGLFSNTNLRDRIMEAQAVLIENNIYEREQIVWSDYTFDFTDEPYMKSWLSDRLLYLDGYFDQLSNIEAITPNHGFLIYPNPVSTELTVTSTIFQSYLLYDMYGKVIQQGEVKLGSNQIDFSALPNGIYYFKLNGRVEKIVHF